MQTVAGVLMMMMMMMFPSLYTNLSPSSVCFVLGIIMCSEEMNVSLFLREVAEQQHSTSRHKSDRRLEITIIIQSFSFCVVVSALSHSFTR